MIQRILNRLKSSDSATDTKSVAVAYDRRQLLTGLLLICVVVIVGLVVGDWVINYAHGSGSGAIRRLFNITREDGLASWVAVTLTGLVALTMWALWVLSRVSCAGKATRVGWLVLAISFTYLAIDDGAMIHERLGTTLGDASTAGWLANFPSYYWQIIFVPILGLFGLYFVYFMIRTLSTPRQRLAVILALGCLVAAVGLDFFEGMAPGSSWNIYSWIADGLDFERYTMRTFGETEYDTLEHFSKAIEESLEMFAMSLLWVTTLAHLSAHYPRVTLKAT